MPKVCDKEFSYTDAGKKAAKKYAEKTGKKMTNKGYKGGKTVKPLDYQSLVKKKFGGRV